VVTWKISPYKRLSSEYFRDNRRHRLPHIHVCYRREAAAMAIEDGLILAGSLLALEFANGECRRFDMRLFA
jgi:hypothetical protein